MLRLQTSRQAVCPIKNISPILVASYTATAQANQVQSQVEQITSWSCQKRETASERCNTASVVATTSCGIGYPSLLSLTSLYRARPFLSARACCTAQRRDSVVPPVSPTCIPKPCSRVSRIGSSLAGGCIRKPLWLQVSESLGVGVRIRGSLPLPSTS